MKLRSYNYIKERGSIIILDMNTGKQIEIDPMYLYYVIENQILNGNLNEDQIEQLKETQVELKNIIKNQENN